MNELKTRGVTDVLIAVVDGLKSLPSRKRGFAEAIGTVFPLAMVQTPDRGPGQALHRAPDRQLAGFCVPRLRGGRQWKDRKIIMPDLKAIDRAETAESAPAGLAAFEAQWGRRYPAIGQAWPRAWEHVVPLFAFPPANRKMIYTTNAVESLHRSLRKIIKTRGQLSHRRGGAQTAVSGDRQCWGSLAPPD
jgi:putative transposase